MIARIAYGLLFIFVVVLVVVGLASGFGDKEVPETYTPSVPQWIKITKTYSDFSTAGTSNTITIYTLPAKSVLHTVIMKPTTAFSGGTIASYTISVGRTGALQDFITNSNVLGSPSPTVSFKPVAAMIPTAWDFSSTTAIVASAISTIGNLNAATQGAADIYLLISILP